MRAAESFREANWSLTTFQFIITRVTEILAGNYQRVSRKLLRILFLIILGFLKPEHVVSYKIARPRLSTVRDRLSKIWTFFVQCKCTLYVNIFNSRNISFYQKATLKFYSLDCSRLYDTVGNYSIIQTTVYYCWIHVNVCIFFSAYIAHTAISQ